MLDSCDARDLFVPRHVGASLDPSLTVAVRGQVQDAALLHFIPYDTIGVRETF